MHWTFHLFIQIPMLIALTTRSAMLMAIRKRALYSTTLISGPSALLFNSETSSGPVSVDKRPFSSVRRRHMMNPGTDGLHREARQSPATSVKS